MIETIIILSLVGLAMFLVYLAVAKFAPGTPANITGIVLAVIFLLIVLYRFGIFR